MLVLISLFVCVVMTPSGNEFKSVGMSEIVTSEHSWSFHLASPLIGPCAVQCAVTQLGILMTNISTLRTKLCAVRVCKPVLTGSNPTVIKNYSHKPDL